MTSNTVIWLAVGAAVLWALGSQSRSAAEGVWLDGRWWPVGSSPDGHSVVTIIDGTAVWFPDRNFNA